MTDNKLNIDDIVSVIKSEQYYVFPDTTLTVCCLTLVNGFNVTGESACLEPSNFDQGIGETIAKDRAVQKIWALEGYLIKERMSSGDFD